VLVVDAAGEAAQPCDGGGVQARAVLEAPPACFAGEAFLHRCAPRVLKSGGLLAVNVLAGRDALKQLCAVLLDAPFARVYVLCLDPNFVFWAFKGAEGQKTERQRQEAWRARQGAKAAAKAKAKEDKAKAKAKVSVAVAAAKTKAGEAASAGSDGAGVAPLGAGGAGGAGACGSEGGDGDDSSDSDSDSDSDSGGDDGGGDPSACPPLSWRAVVARAERCAPLLRLARLVVDPLLARSAHFRRRRVLLGWMPLRRLMEALEDEAVSV
jgi:hypothetical protein